MRTLAVYSIKGGVGKTTTAVNLAYLAARQGLRTLVWDLDPQGAASFYFRIRPKVKGVRRLIRRRRDLRLRVRGTDFEMLDLLPADFSYRNLDLLLSLNKKPRKTLRKLLRPLTSSYDWVFLDCAPSISVVSEAVFAAAVQGAFAGDKARGARHQLHQAARAGGAFGADIEGRFLADEGVDQGAVDVETAQRCPVGYGVQGGGGGFDVVDRQLEGKCGHIRAGGEATD